MLKNWKSLFIKSTEPQAGNKPATESFSFPVNNTSTSSFKNTETAPAQPALDPVITEVVEVYEAGLDSINMPGYDFYEFYKTVTSTGHASEQTYQMAYHMAKTLDKTITAHKLITDADFYVSKINEVHGQYVSQGQQKLNSLQESKGSEKSMLQADIDQMSMRISQLRAELQQLEADISLKRNSLSKIDDNFYPKEKAIREKLIANDTARKVSIDKLNHIKEGILKYIKA
jgi:hypothetical protein